MKIKGTEIIVGTVFGVIAGLLTNNIAVGLLVFALVACLVNAM